MKLTVLSMCIRAALGYLAPPLWFYIPMDRRVDPVAVYVDDMKAKFGRMVMCHMLADTYEELIAMADKIGVDRKWIQHKGEPGEHFDIALSKRALAVQNGAVEITWREAGRMTMERRKAAIKVSHGKV